MPEQMQEPTEKNEKQHDMDEGCECCEGGNCLCCSGKESCGKKSLIMIGLVAIGEEKEKKGSSRYMRLDPEEQERCVLRN